MIALGLQRYAFQSYQVFGQSMSPSLQEGDYLIISKLNVIWEKLTAGQYVPERGSIIVFDNNVSGNRLIKRVIGLPRERVVVDNGRVRVFNAERPEGFDPYQELALPARFADGQLSLTVPDNHIFVMGDNRQAGGSLDSRSDLGPIPTNKVIGRLAVRLWPFSNFEKY